MFNLCFRKEEARRDCKLGVIIISDLAELSHETVYMPAVKAYMNVLGILQVCFQTSVSLDVSPAA